MKSLYSDKYRYFLKLLIEGRKKAGVTQDVLARKLGRPQSFVSKVENGERRIDAVEFLIISRQLGIDPCALLRKVDGVKRKG